MGGTCQTGCFERPPDLALLGVAVAQLNLVSTPLTLDELLAVVEQPSSLSELQTYFGRIDGVLPFTGACFDFLSGGGDDPAVANRVTADDLVAVQLLGVVVPPRVAVDLLEGDLGERVARELRDIPTNVELGSPEARPMLDDGGVADRASRLLEEPDDMGWATACKLLARKRPRLVPVHDRVVRCAFGPPKPMWTWLNDYLAGRGGKLPHQLQAVRAAAGLPPTLSLPRVLDVIVWMRHRASHRPSKCPRSEFAKG